MQLSEYLAVSQSGGEIDHKMSDTWAGAHLVSGANPRATHGFHWGYMLQGRPLECKEKTRGGDPPFHPPSPASVILLDFSPTEQPPLDPLSALIDVFFFLFSVQRFTWLTLGCCYVKHEQHAVMLSIWFWGNYATAELHEEPCVFQHRTVGLYTRLWNEWKKKKNWVNQIMKDDSFTWTLLE